MDEDQANYTKVRFKCKRSTSLHHCSVRCTLTPNFLFVFKLCYVSRYLKHTSQQILDTGNLRSDLPYGRKGERGYLFFED